jgi:hypothetical protein
MEHLIDKEKLGDPEMVVKPSGIYQEVDNENTEVYGQVTKDGKDYYVTKDRLWIRLIAFNPLLVRKAMKGTELPKRPQYEAKTLGGRIERHPLDEVSAKDDPRDQARWESYLEEREEAITKRTDATTLALFAYGCDFEIPNTGWEVMQELIGIEIPTQPTLRKVHYLETVLDPSDLQGLLSALTRKMGVGEAEVKEAEDTFRD